MNKISFDKFFKIAILLLALYLLVILTKISVNIENGRYRSGDFPLVDTKTGKIYIGEYTRTIDKLRSAGIDLEKEAERIKQINDDTYESELENVNKKIYNAIGENKDEYILIANLFLYMVRGEGYLLKIEK